MAASQLHADLLLAYRGTANFLRCLSLLRGVDYEVGAEYQNGRSRRETISWIGYSARTYARLAESVRTDTPLPQLGDERERFDAEVRLGSTLPARALRHLVEHSAVHLRVEWRDLSESDWTKPIANGVGPAVTPATTVKLRAGEVWLAALDLHNGVRESDIPLRARQLVGEARIRAGSLPW